jgi:hypothetical protein
MDRGQVAGPEVGAVGDQLHRMRLRRGHDFAHLGDATDLGDAGLRNID